ncbi:uncharacterized protein [Solanum lycopersicum]|uniref:uncharacterized protein n=1 Tax=Solanum lycopersicum TaxID=4081 RepID=UPI003747F7C6
MNEDPQEFVDEVYKILFAMGVNKKEKADLAAYQLKDVAQVWYKMWADGRAPEAITISWDILKTTFLESKDEIRKFMTGVSEDMEEEFRASMLRDKMDLYRLMVHTQQVEESLRRKRGREGKNPRPSYQAGSRSGRSSFGVQDRPKFKKGHQRSGNPTLSWNSNAKVDKSGPIKGNDRNAQRNSNMYGICGRFHGGECLVGTNICYGCGKSGHMVSDCPQMKNQAKKDAQPWPNPTATVEPPKRNRFYALKLDPGFTLSFVTPLVSSKFDLLPEILHGPFLVSTTIGDGIRDERVYKECTMNIHDRVTYGDLIELVMLDFDIILGMDWLQKCYATIDCRNRVVKFQFPNELELEWEGRGSNPKSQIISNLKANRMLSKGYLYRLVRVNDLENEVPSIDYVSIVNEFQDVIPEDLP